MEGWVERNSVVNSAGNGPPRYEPSHSYKAYELGVGGVTTTGHWAFEAASEETTLSKESYQADNYSVRQITFYSSVSEFNKLVKILAYCLDANDRIDLPLLLPEKYLLSDTTVDCGL